jgi:hypothetical protein
LVTSRHSLNPREYWIFKPKDTITGEPFNLHLTFKNNSNRKFSGGKCRLYIDTAHGIALTYYETSIPEITPRNTVDIVYEDLVVQEPGFSAFWVQVYTNSNEAVLEDNNQYKLTNANMEELYQKYAVVVALFFSTLATALTIVNIIVSLLR